jgi:hypothetical protein
MKVFKEQQRFTQWWIWLPLISLLLLFIYGAIQQLFFGIPYGDKPMSNLGIILFSLFFFLFVLFFRLLTLKVNIDEKGISYKFSPLHRSDTFIDWKNILTVSIITFKPILDVGGWGIKHGSYTVKGNIGIKLSLKNGEQVIIGTQKKAEATQILNTYINKI